MDYKYSDITKKLSKRLLVIQVFNGKEFITKNTDTN